MEKNRYFIKIDYYLYCSFNIIFIKMNKPGGWVPLPSDLYTGILPVKIEISSTGPIAFMVDGTFVPISIPYSRCSHEIKKIVYDPTTNTITFLFGSHPCWTLVIINVQTKKVFSSDLDNFAPSMCLVPGILLLFIRSNCFYVNLASKDFELKNCDLDPTLYLRSDFNELDRATKTFSGVVEARYLGNDLVCVITRSGTSSVLKVKLDSDGKLVSTVILGLIPGGCHFTLSPCGRFLIWCEVNAVRIHYVDMCFTDESPLFTVDGKDKIHSLTFSVKDGRSIVVAVLKDGPEVMSAPLF
jgi:hypothetical protein